MHRPRLLGWEDVNCYHLISRTTGRELLFGEQEREMFAKMVAKLSRFCGVEVLTWCCLSNHFHLLVRISDEETGSIRERLRSDREWLLQHLRGLYVGKDMDRIAAGFKQLEAEGRGGDLDAMVEGYLRRIGDLAVFIKELKQRFSIWFNRRHGRSGTLWSAKFRSVLVENSSQALRMVASYIDLNPVRAGLVRDPQDYRWSGFGQAMGGGKTARAGLRAVVGMAVQGTDALVGVGEPNPPEGSARVSAKSAGSRVTLPTWQRAMEDYRVLLYGRGTVIEDGDGRVLRRGIDPGEVKRVIDAGGAVSSSELFRLRVRHLTKGGALGSAGFLQGVLLNRPLLVGAKRRSAARKIRWLSDESEAEAFQSLRDLREK